MHGSHIEPGPAACWASYALSSRHPVAVAAYHDGIAALVAGAPFAGTLLRRALILDPDFALAGVGLAVVTALAGDPFVPDGDPARMTRGERQHVEILQTAFGGDGARATDLRRVHLLEFPGDVLIVWLPAALDLRSRRQPDR